MSRNDAALSTTTPPAIVDIHTNSPQETNMPSTTPPVSPSSTTDVQSDPAQRQETQLDPQIAALHAMFPDYDDTLLQSVLHSVGGNQDRAIDALLSMSDPQYKSEVREGGPPLSQVDLDEQLARRLMLEEQQQQHQNQQQHQRQRQQDVPYQPYSSSHRRSLNPQQPQSAAASERDTITEIQDQVTKFAESGKKTLESLFMKVKTKIQEFDKPSGSSEQPIQPTWGGNTGTPTPSRSYTMNSNQQPSYYDPNPRAVPSTPPPISKHVPPPIQGFDVAPERSPVSVDPENAGAKASSEASPRSSIGTRQPTPIDAGKLGLLPKRPVSLLKPETSVQDHERPRHNPSDDDDSLEYTENPFEESRK